MSSNQESIYSLTHDDNFLETLNVNEEITLELIPTKEIAYKESSTFGSYMCEIIDEDESMVKTFMMAGNFIRPLDLGQSYSAKGTIADYRGKKQFKMTEINKIMPKDERGIISFLRSLDGVRHMADVIYEEYGSNSLKVIQNNPYELLKYPTLYEELVLSWKSQIDNLKDDYAYLARLMEYGLKASQAKELYDKYSESIFDKINENPYFLSKQLGGYSFTKCDRIAQKIGFHPEDPQRLCEGMMYILSTLNVNGDTYFEYDYFINMAAEELSIKLGIMELKRIEKDIRSADDFIYMYGKTEIKIKPQNIYDAIRKYNGAFSQKQKDKAKLLIFPVTPEKIEEALNILIYESRIIVEDKKVYRKEMYGWECGIAVELKNLLSGEKQIDNINIPQSLTNYLNSANIILEEMQLQAVSKAISSYGGILIIDGSAGCGKTFCMKIALKMMEVIHKANNKYFEKIIIAPTGKASKVAQKATGIPAFTIHRALSYSPVTRGYFYNATNKLPYDCIVIDEASMLDTELTYHLFSAIATGTKVIIMGDTKQLPSIGAGNVLRDLILSQRIPNITLNVVKRQGLDSGITINARNIIAGQMITTQKETGDAVVYKADSEDAAHQRIFNVFEKLLEHYEMDEIQVLSPQKTGGCGTNYLNFLLQEKFNPENNEIRFLNKQISVIVEKKTYRFDLFFKKGDKVINTRNNYIMPCYELQNGKLIATEMSGITNGETGTIVKLIESKNEFNEMEKKIIVKFEDKYMIYENDFENLEHAYVLTIHKSQGSEWKAVILVMMSNNILMLDRNLLYTGYTRAREMIATITTPEIMKTCLNRQNSINRNTGLQERIKEHTM